MIRIEKFSPINSEKLISWIDTAEFLMQFAGPSLSFPLTSEQLDKSLSDPNRFAFQAMGSPSEAVIGYCEIFLTVNSALLGRIIIGDQKFRSEGYGRIIVNQLIDYAHETLQQTIIELNVFDWNVSTINCYKKCGFVFNPDKRSVREINGKTWNVLNMILMK